MRHYYNAYGLTINSYRSLHSLRSASAFDGEADVEVQSASLDRPDQKGEGRRTVTVLSEEKVLLHWKDWVTLLVRNGREILVDQIPGSDDQLTNLLISGTGLGIILHQLKRVTLHASAALTDHGAVAFLGQKGMGKSTTVANMMKNGYPMITDDILPVRTSKIPPWTSPGEKIFKLWPDSASATIGQDDPRLKDLYEGSKKKVGEIDENMPQKIPIDSIYFLEYEKKDQKRSTKIDKISKKESHIRIVKNSYSIRFLGNKGVCSWYFDSINKIISNVPCFRIARTRNLGNLDEITSKMVKKSKRCRELG